MHDFPVGKNKLTRGWPEGAVRIRARRGRGVVLVIEWNTSWFLPPVNQ